MMKIEPEMKEKFYQYFCEDFINQIRILLQEKIISHGDFINTFGFDPNLEVSVIKELIRAWSFQGLVSALKSLGLLICPVVIDLPGSKEFCFVSSRTLFNCWEKSGNPRDGFQLEELEKTGRINPVVPAKPEGAYHDESQSHWTSLNTTDLSFSLAMDFMDQIEDRRLAKGIGLRKMAEYLGESRNHIRRRLNCPFNMTVFEMIDWSILFRTTLNLVLYEMKKADFEKRGPLFSRVFSESWRLTGRPHHEIR